MPEPRTAVAIVSMNDSSWLAPCLRALSSACDDTVHLVVIANDCSDGTLEVCELAPRKPSVIQTQFRLGYAAANNLALQWSLDRGFEFAMLLNADTVVHPECVTTLVRFLDSQPAYGIAGSLQFEYGDHSWTRLNDWSTEILESARLAGHANLEAPGFRWIDSYYVQGAAMLIRLSNLKRVGLLDPAYGSFYEETDLCRRHLLLNIKVGLVLNSKVWHYGGGNWRASRDRRLERDRLYLRNQFIYYLSGEQSVAGMLSRLGRLLVRHCRAILHGHEEVTMPCWRYLGVIFSAARKANKIRLLASRNRIIRSGRDLPDHLISIGE